MLKLPFMREPTLQHASRQEIEAGIERSLAGLGMSLTDLRDEARSGQFRTQRARLVWSSIRDVVSKD